MTPLDQLPCAVLYTDHRGEILQVNPELLRIVGVTSLQSGALFEELLPPASRIFLQTHVWPMLLREGAVREIYLLLRAVDATRVPVTVNATTGELAGRRCYIWVMLPTRERSLFEAELIKARNRAESNAIALQGREHFTRALTDLSGLAMGFLDLSTRCQFANTRLEALLGEYHANLDSRAWHTLFAPAERIVHRLAVEQALTGATARSTALPLALPGRPPWRAIYVASRARNGVIDGCFIVEHRGGEEC